MACPTCDHTMQRLAEVDGHGVYWCPRCGTFWHKGLTEAPKLVERCRSLQTCLIEAEQPDGVEAMRVLGIAESINPPERRPK